MPSSIYLVTGGARSGKSSYAERLCESLSNNPIYLATAPAAKDDDDFAQRIQKHQQQRTSRGNNVSWKTIEETLHPSKYLEEFQNYNDNKTTNIVVLVDCLTLWLTNFMIQEGAFASIEEDDKKNDDDCEKKNKNKNNNKNNNNDQIVSEATDRALQSAKEEFNKLIQPWDATYVFVTNELGSGTHATSHLARKFVDAQGWFNQHVASKSQIVVHMVCGIPNIIKNDMKRNETILLQQRGSTSTSTPTDQGAHAAVVEASMLDKLLSSRKMTMDSKGYFMIKIEDDNDNNKVIVATFHSCMINDKGEVCDLKGNKIKCDESSCGNKKSRPEPMKVWKCRTAKELTTEIFERWDDLESLEISVGHAAYIGREAQKAELCLYSGKPYQQN